MQDEGLEGKTSGGLRWRFLIKGRSLLNNYAGVYDAGQVSVKDGYLIFRPSFKKVDRRLIPASADTFMSREITRRSFSSVRSPMVVRWTSSFRRSRVRSHEVSLGLLFPDRCDGASI